MDTAKQEKKVVSARKFTGKTAAFAVVFAVIVSLLHIWHNSYSLTFTIKKNAISLGMMMVFAFLTYPAASKSDPDNPSLLDWVLAGLSMMIGLFIFFNYDALVIRQLMPTKLEYAIAIMSMLLLLEASRRCVGWILPILSVFFILYAKYGQFFPGVFRHKGFLWTRILTRMCLTDTGIYGTSLTVAASYVFMFIMFGCFLAHSGTGKFFNDFAIAFAGRLRGGPAQVAVISSALMGTMSGSAQANVATTGAFTIPLMKKTGYSARFAAAVEASASTGGILMPPVMGAASFVMASFLGMPYATIMVAGAIPALLYYFSVFCMVDLRAQRIGLKGVPKDELPAVSVVLKEYGHMVIPIVVVIYTLLAGYTALMAAFFGIISTVVCSSLRKKTRMSPRNILDALVDSARSSVTVVVACALVGFIVCSVGMTGLGQVVALNIMKLCGGHLWLALILVMIATIILGMGLPSTACYIITASVAVPALVNMGVPPLAAHMFCFYYGTMSGVVPPVALTSYTAAGLAGADPMKVALSGFLLASAGLIIPYCFVSSPVMLFQGAYTVAEVSLVIATGCAGIFLLATAIEGYFRGDIPMFIRVPLFGCAVCMVIPGIRTDIIGVVCTAILLAVLMLIRRGKPEQTQV